MDFQKNFPYPPPDPCGTRQIGQVLQRRLGQNTKCNQIALGRCSCAYSALSGMSKLLKDNAQESRLAISAAKEHYGNAIAQSNLARTVVLGLELQSSQSRPGLDPRCCVRGNPVRSSVYRCWPGALAHGGSRGSGQRTPSWASRCFPQYLRAINAPQGRITSGLIHLPTFNPYTDAGLIVYRAVAVLPEPEIYLPPGTDLRLRLNLLLYEV